jgi:hypothetical protein
VVLQDIAAHGFQDIQMAQCPSLRVPMTLDLPAASEPSHASTPFVILCLGAAIQHLAVQAGWKPPAAVQHELWQARQSKATLPAPPMSAGWMEWAINLSVQDLCQQAQAAEAVFHRSGQNAAQSFGAALWENAALAVDHAWSKWYTHPDTSAVNKAIAIRDLKAIFQAKGILAERPELSVSHYACSPLPV